LTYRRRTPRFAFSAFVLPLAELMLVSLLFLAGCDIRDATETDGARGSGDLQEASAALPELAAIGGVRDVWAFDFPMTASRDEVRSALGEPQAVSESETNRSSSGPEVVLWIYDGLEVTFLLDEHGEHEYLLSVKIDHPSVPLRGGLRVGMPLEEALRLLGEPRVSNERSRVYFYRDTTIELVVEHGEVAAVHLARALP
jgi:hypothetical protein